MAKTKDVEVNGYQFRIGRLSPLIGTQIAMRHLTATQAEMIEQEKQLLKVCCQLVEGKPLPVLMEDGRWAMKELEDDVATVGMLYLESFQFNVTPFINALASRAQSEMPGADLSQSNSQT